MAAPAIPNGQLDSELARGSFGAACKVDLFGTLESKVRR
jgi:hypothetical protein